MLSENIVDRMSVIQMVDPRRDLLEKKPSSPNNPLQKAKCDI